MKISVLGCGRWGSFIAWYLDTIGHKISLYGRAGSEHIKAFQETRTNGQIRFNERVAIVTDLKEALQAETIVISIPSQNLRSLLQQIRQIEPAYAEKTFVLCMKGIEIESGKRLSEVFYEEMGKNSRLAVWLGPGHVQEFVAGVPNCMVIDSDKEEVKEKLVAEFKGPLIRFYYGNDMIGNEIGAASKNVIGIAAGLLDGMGLSSLKGALMARGTREIARLIAKMGGNELSAYGLCHLGDYEATVFSPYSHNRAFGEKYAKGEPYELLAEGYYTVKALKKMAEENGVDLPICNAVYAVLYENLPLKEALSTLFTRSLKTEF